MIPSPHIVVVGAGLAGLTAAYRLQEKGYDVQVYEARHRPGGRVLTAHIGEGYEELGGKNFRDGGDPVHSLQLIQDVGLEPLDSEIPFAPLYVDGPQVIPFFDMMRKIKDPEGIYGKMEEASTRSQNLQEVIDTVFEDPLLCQRFTSAMRNYEGSEPKNLDAASFTSLHIIFSIFFEAMKEMDDGKAPTFTWLTVKGGNAKLPQTLANKLKRKVQYGQPLKALRQDNQGMTLTFGGGHKVQADLVLLAIPGSVFGDIDFSFETMSPEAFDLIQKVQYGTNGKILFPLSIPAHPHAVLAASHMFSWSNEADTVRTFYYGGEYGVFDFQKAKSLFNQGLNIIKTAYPDLILSPPGLEPAKDGQFAAYKEGVFISWIHDPYAKGSYANRAPGTASWFNEMVSLRGEQVRKVFSPLNERLFFAGEHTTTLDLLGTLEGAIESGERLARLIDKTVREAGSVVSQAITP